MVRTVLVLVALSSCKAAEEKPAAPPPASPSPSPTPTAPAPPGNVVQQEMRMLTALLQATVEGIGAGDVRPIEHKLHSLHAAKEATTAAVRGGAYKLPKGADDVAQFEALDEAFHEHLGALVKASRANDVPAAADALGAIMRGCHGCHAAFRPSP